jgi:hypothetical protein
MSILAILIQVAITLIIVACYHLWVSRNKQPASAPPVLVAPIPAPLKSSPAAEKVPPEVIAVIAAAIAVVIGRPHRVLSVQQGLASTPEVNVWALEGRMEHFMSHKVR